MMIQDNSVAAVNERLARQINEQARSDPDSRYAGKFVGIANGKIVIVGDGWPEVVAAVRRAEPDPSRCRCIEASADYDSVVDIWSAA